jgi:hypothetical protein
MSEFIFLALVLLAVALPHGRLFESMYYHSKAVSERLDHANFFFYMAKLPFVRAFSYLMASVVGFMALYVEQLYFGYFWLQLSVLIGATLVFIWSPFNRFKPRGVFWFYIGIYAFLGLPMLAYYLILLGITVALTRSWVLGLVSTFGLMFVVLVLQNAPAEYFFVQFWLLFVVVLRYLDELVNVMEGRGYPTLDRAYFTR